MDNIEQMDFNRKLVDIIIPTFNNMTYLGLCMKSIGTHTEYDKENPFFHVWVVNNGTQGIIDKHIEPSARWTLLDEDENRGWEGALEDATPYTDAPIICAMNDDVMAVPGNKRWMHDILEVFWKYPDVGAVGSISNYAFGAQGTAKFLDCKIAGTELLSGFCLFLRRKALEEAGGWGKDLEGGGDDVDLAIRLKMKGWKLAIRGDVFLYHYGCRTGSRLHADWVSTDKETLMRRQMIKRYGLKNFMETFRTRAWDIETGKDVVG